MVFLVYFIQNTPKFSNSFFTPYNADFVYQREQTATVNNMLNAFIQTIVSRTFTTQSVKITAFNYFKQVVCKISKTAVKRVIKTVSVTYFACNELRYRNIICYMFQLLGYLMSIVSSVWSLKSNPTVALQCFIKAKTVVANLLRFLS